MKLCELLKDVECAVFGDINIDITGVEYDSRNVKPGDLFFCITGFVTDGHKYAGMAVERGAKCVVVTRKLEIDAVQVMVKDDREAMALISAAFYGKPADELCMIGVTGTNGKTSTTYMLKRILEQQGKKVGLIGTIKNMIGDVELHTERTTPESPDLQRLLADMRDSGVDAVVMEVSSHSLSLKRVAGITFDAGVFTNLTQDHLDYHGTFENYAAAKRILAECSRNMSSNTDDEYGEYMLAGSLGKKLAYGVNTGDMRADNVKISAYGTEFTLKYGRQSIPVKLKIAGRFTVYNAMSALSACVMLGYDLRDSIRALSTLEGVAGRFETLDTRGMDAAVVLDYAHTPDSLENTLKTARDVAEGRVVCIFGCGGNRDNTKRPIMGRISGELADFSVITSDNPRCEKPMDIIAQIESGIKETDGEYAVIENRREAIKFALQNHKKGDIIVLAGKGHEDYQEIDGVKYPFDEKVVVSELLDELGY